MILPLSTKLSDLDSNHETDSLVDPLCSSLKIGAHERREATRKSVKLH